MSDLLDKAENKWVAFYRPMFSTADEVSAFVESLEPLRGGHPRHPAKIMMHQTQRLVSLADDLPEIRKQNETLPLLFLIVCAEHIAKQYDDFKGEGRSRAYVHNFFKWFLSPEQQTRLCKGFATRRERTPRPDLTEVVDILYRVRCDVVHEGKYWGFHFGEETTGMINADPDVNVYITFSGLRDLVVQGCIAAIQRYKVVA